MKKDKKVFALIKAENKRQNECLELIASENFASKSVRQALSSCLTNKYAEGYPGHRYYGGCENVDQLEQLAIDRACRLFNCKFANVQPHSGSQANAEAYRALEKMLEEDHKLYVRGTGKVKVHRQMKILAMELGHGGHLSHGSSVSFSSNLYDFSYYKLGEDRHIHFDLVEEAIKANRPDVILAGYSSYPYEIDFSKFKELAIKYDCKLMVDMAHIAGLVAAGECMSPIPYADIVTTTTHKTLRGPRGGLILTNDERLIKYVNQAVFPYYQGGPLENTIAAKAICFEEAYTDEFKKYIKMLKANMQAFSKRIRELGGNVSDTDNHLVLLNTKDTFNLLGITAQLRLEDIGITTNKNLLPEDDESPANTSGLRIGFAALTTRGCTPDVAVEIADIIWLYLQTYNYLILNDGIKDYKEKVKKLARTKLRKI